MNEVKCQWFLDGGMMEHYHDEEWGIPCHDDRKLYEYLMLECLSVGLSWTLMLRKRDIFRACFADFDYTRVAAFTAEDVARVMESPGMIRSQRKIEAVISNAQRFMELCSRYGSFDQYIWHFTQGRTLIYQRRLDGEWLTTSELSDTVAKDLKRNGFKFLGSTLVYSYLQSIGIINDHETSCYMYRRIGGVIV